MRSSQVTAGDTGTIGQYNKLRDDAKASSWLLPHEQSTPALTLYVEGGSMYFGSTLVEFAGGNSPSFTAPATNPRIDILSIDSTGTLIRTAGTEAGSPVAPSLPAGNIPICQVYNRVGQTQVYDTDQGAGKGYILKDIRSNLLNVDVVFGDGSDGNVTISGTTNLTRDMYYNDLTVTGTLNTAGYRVFIKGKLTGNGTIQNNGNNGSGATAGAATVGYFSNVAGSNGGSGGAGSGVAGNAGANTANQSNLLITTASSSGGDGGSQAGASGASAGTSGTRTASLTKIGIVKSFTVNGLDIAASGSTVKFLPSMGGLGGGGAGGGNSSGGNGTGGSGGGGGAGGGILAIFVNDFGGSVSLNAIGGNGGNGGNASGSIGGGGSGGAGGNGGYILVVYNSKSWTGAYNVSGGTGGSVGTPNGSGGAGTAGAAGSAGATNEISVYNMI